MGDVKKRKEFMHIDYSIEPSRELAAVKTLRWREKIILTIIEDQNRREQPFWEESGSTITGSALLRINKEALGEQLGLSVKDVENSIHNLGKMLIVLLEKETAEEMFFYLNHVYDYKGGQNGEEG